MKDLLEREQFRSPSPDRRKKLRKTFLQRIQRKISLKQSIEYKNSYESENIF